MHPLLNRTSIIITPTLYKYVNRNYKGRLTKLKYVRHYITYVYYMNN